MLGPGHGDEWSHASPMSWVVSNPASPNRRAVRVQYPSFARSEPWWAKWRQADLDRRVRIAQEGFSKFERLDGSRPHRCGDDGCRSSEHRPDSHREVRGTMARGASAILVSPDKNLESILIRRHGTAQTWTPQLKRGRELACAIISPPNVRCSHGSEQAWP